MFAPAFDRDAQAHPIRVVGFLLNSLIATIVSIAVVIAFAMAAGFALPVLLSLGQLCDIRPAAAATIDTISVVLAGWLAQKSLTRGLTLGAIR